MKLYRVSLYSTEYGHRGYVWHPSAWKANEDARNYIANDPADHKATVVRVEVPIDKAGLLRALNRLAGHPDNG